MFWNHSKQHSSKTSSSSRSSLTCFGTIRNNTALKQKEEYAFYLKGFGTIRNNTALKQKEEYAFYLKGFGTIRNNTALKLQAAMNQIKAVLEPFETTQL